MTSPLHALCATLLNKMSGGSQFSMFFSDERRRRLLQGLFNAFYEEAGERVIFDTNRLWTGRVAMLAALFPHAKIVCCVRDVGWIIDSTERVLRQNPLQTSRLFNYEPGQSVYARTEVLMNSDTGFIGNPWSCLREAWFGEHASRLIVIEYEALSKHPAETMHRLYLVLGERPFVHDFENVVYDEPDYDAVLGMPGMHKVAAKVQYIRRDPCIPPDIMNKYAGLCFWRNADRLKESRATVI